MTQLETQKQMCEILMPSRGFDAVMKTSCRIIDPKRDGGGGGEIRNAHAPHQITTACFIVPKQQRTPSPQPRSAVASSTVHHLSGQVHINQKPTCLSVDAENDISPVRGGWVFTKYLTPKHRQACARLPSTPQGRAEGVCQCKLTQFRTSRTGKQLRRAGRTSETVVVEGPV